MDNGRTGKWRVKLPTCPPPCHSTSFPPFWSSTPQSTGDGLLHLLVDHHDEEGKRGRQNKETRTPRRADWCELDALLSVSSPEGEPKEIRALTARLAPVAGERHAKRERRRERRREESAPELTVPATADPGLHCSFVGSRGLKRARLICTPGASLVGLLGDCSLEAKHDHQCIS